MVIEHRMANQNVGRDELAALLGASHASDMVAAAGTTATDLTKKSLTSGASGGAGRAKHYTKGGEIDDDISKMDRAQAAALVARKFAGGEPSSSVGGGVARHRATGKRKRMLQHHLLVGDLMEQQQQQQAGDMSAMEQEDDVAKSYQKSQENDDDEGEEDSFIRADTARKKTEAKVLAKRDNGRNGRRRRGSSSSSSDSESSQRSEPSSDGSSQRRRRNRNRGRRSRSNSSSSSSEDEADIRRRRARERASQKNQQDEGVVVTSIDHGERNDRGVDEELKQQQHNHVQKDISEEDMSVDNGSSVKEEEVKIDETQQNEKESKISNARNHKRSDSSSSSSSSSGDSSSSSSSSSDSSSDESDHNSTLPMSISKPLFVPKSKRGTVAEIELQQQKHEEAEKQRLQQAEKRAIQSRALVAEAVSASGKNGVSNDVIGGEDEFDTGEAGGEFIVVPDDTDPNEEDSPELVMAERDAWEVRELIRILRDVDEALDKEKERKEVERRRALTDEERLMEDKRTGRYQAPGQSRRQRAGGKDGKSSAYLQKFHHRGAFYMDEDTLAQAGADDVRHRAAEYSRAATGEDKIDKSALPEVMQVKNFGFAGYSTKYKGLAKEDTTDKQLDFLPVVRGKKKGLGRGNGDSGGQRYNGVGADRDR